MLSNYIKYTKIFFTGFIGLWLVMIAMITQNRTLERQVALLEHERSYLLYKVELGNPNEYQSLASVVTSLGNIFKEPQSIMTASASSTSETKSIPVLLYHGLVSKPDRFSTTPENFKNQMFALKRAGYETVKVNDFIAFIKGERPLPEKSFLLTFDDGRVDSYREADPILRALGWSAVMFVATEQSLPARGINEYYINDEQIKDMVSSGRWEIESHAVQLTGGQITINEDGTTGNLLSNKQWLKDEGRFEMDQEYEERLNNELGVSKYDLENLIKKPVRTFSYPYGDYGQESHTATATAQDLIKSTLMKMGYEVAFHQTWERDNFYTFNYTTNEDYYRLRRIEPASDWNGKYLLHYLESATPKSLPYFDSLTQNNGWKNPWGVLNFDKDGLHLKPSEGDTGAFAFLDGTRLWENYSFRITAEKNAEGYLTLFARYENDQNYVACTFGENLVRIDQKLDGNVSYLAERKVASNLPQWSNYAISVNGNTVTCLENDEKILSNDLVDQSISYGGVGIRVWDEVADRSFLNAKLLQAENVESNNP